MMSLVKIRFQDGCRSYNMAAAHAQSWPQTGAYTTHINDISESISSNIKLFADDCVCYREIENISDCHLLQEDINKLGKWANNWGMRFQPVKCNMMTLSRKRNKISYEYTLQ